MGTAAGGGTLVSEALRLYPNVILADITMAALSGIDAAHCASPPCRHTKRTHRHD